MDAAPHEDIEQLRECSFEARHAHWHPSLGRTRPETSIIAKWDIR